MKKKKLLMIALPVLLLLGGGTGAYFAGVLPIGGDASQEEKIAELDAEHGDGDHTKKEGKDGEEQKDFVFYELPDIVVNLSSNTKRRGGYLKIKINLELADEDQVKKLEDVMPRVVDNLQVYLRELRVEDIQGSEGLYRLREELLHRINVAATPTKVKDVLFAEMLMQ